MFTYQCIIGQLIYIEYSEFSHIPDISGASDNLIYGGFEVFVDKAIQTLHYVTIYFINYG